MNLVKKLFHVHKWFHLSENTRAFVCNKDMNLVFKIYPKICEICKEVRWQQE